jgi:hypothetical protein
VAPAAPTPRELKRLSDIDEIDFVRMQISVIQFYRRNESMGGKDPARVIREALANSTANGLEPAPYTTPPKINIFRYPTPPNRIS